MLKLFTNVQNWPTGLLFPREKLSILMSFLKIIVLPKTALSKLTVRESGAAAFQFRLPVLISVARGSVLIPPFVWPLPLLSWPPLFVSFHISFVLYPAAQN